MLELYAGLDDPRTVIDVDLDYEPTKEQKGPQIESAITTMRGRRNSIQVGIGEPIPVLERWPKNRSLDAEVKASIDQYDVYAVRIACSFQADRGCRFVWARMRATLGVPGQQASADRSVTVLDLFPRKVESSQKVRRSYGITSKLKFAFVDVAAKAESKGDEIVYQPALAAAGLLTDSPSWTFESGDRHGLTGSREVFMLVRKPKGEGLEATFAVGGEVQTVFGRLPLLRYRNQELLDRLYRLV